MKRKYEYTLTLNREQAEEITKALEVIMRWKLKQPRLVAEFLPNRIEDVKQTKLVEKYLEYANDIAIPELENMYSLKDEQWHRCYNIYQVIRHAIHEAENPNGHGVDAYPPYKSGNEPLPEITWEKQDKESSKMKKILSSLNDLRKLNIPNPTDAERTRAWKDGFYNGVLSAQNVVSGALKEQEWEYEGSKKS